MFYSELPGSYYYLVPLSGLLGIIVGGAYLLCRVSQWQPVEDIIQRQMKRPLQREFVCALVEVCQEVNLDPENLDTLLEASEETGLLELHTAMMEFFRNRLKLQE